MKSEKKDAAKKGTGACQGDRGVFRRRWRDKEGMKAGAQKRREAQRAQELRKGERAGSTRLGLEVGRFGADSSERFLLVASVSSVIEGQHQLECKWGVGWPRHWRRVRKASNKDFRLWGKNGQDRWRPVGGPSSASETVLPHWLASIIL